MNNFLLREQMNIHLVVLMIALAIPITGASFLNDVSLLVTTLLALQTLLLAFVCSYHITSIKQYSKCCQYCVRIRIEYDRVVKNQPYKINRLSFEEEQLLQYILNMKESGTVQYPIHADDKVCYRKVEKIMQKLEIPLNETPFDVEWRLIIG